MKAVWEWLNGRKVIIGSILLIFAQIMRVIYPDLSGWPEIVEQVASLLGATVAVGGLAHKAVKAQ